MFICGVVVFSMVMGRLSYMVENIDTLNGDQDDDDELEQFFVLLKKFNNNQSISAELQSQIQTFMKDKWKYDKNNFLITNQDKMLMS